jgi:DNA-binding transcriptional regulator GbsR (MarR family)
MRTMSTFEAFFGRTAQIVVLEYLIKNRDQVCYLSGIAEATGLSHSSVARVIAPLLQRGIVNENNIGKKMRTFTLNEDCESLKLLIQLFDNLDGFKDT